MMFTDKGINIWK